MHRSEATDSQLLSFQYRVGSQPVASRPASSVPVTASELAAQPAGALTFSPSAFSDMNLVCCRICATYKIRGIPACVLTGFGSVVLLDSPLAA